MTKKEAAEKVAKLMKLAKGSSNVHEAGAARIQAQKLIEEYQLSGTDLETGEMAAAFDDLIDGFQKLVASHPAVPEGLFNTSAIITDVIHKIKAIPDMDKAAKLKQAAVIIRTASFVAGDHPIVSSLKATFDTALRNHGVSI